MQQTLAASSLATGVRFAPHRTTQSLAPEDDMKRISINLKNTPYDIFVTHHGLSELGPKLRRLDIGKEIMIFTSPRIGKLYLDKLKQSLTNAGFTQIAVHEIPDGEENKKWEEYERCLKALVREFSEPGATPVVLNLGGGVVGDMGGFAAGTFNRGVPYVQVPTTLLGCVDCGVGGKVGINFENLKNKIGIFYQPKLVFADLELLKTLAPREVRSGTAEVIKYGSVCSRELFEYLERNIEKLVALDKQVLMHVATECYALKARVVEKDERDKKKKRVVLNYGHTIGHALEIATDFNLTHGEAISIGMLAAARLGCVLGVCKEDLYNRVRSLIQRAGLPLTPQDLNIKVNKQFIEKVFRSMDADKKFSNGNICFVIPTTIGKWLLEENIDRKLLEEVVRSCLFA